MSIVWLWWGVPLALYGAFLVWYGGRSRPLTPEEARPLLAELATYVHDEPGRSLVDALAELAARDDGREFVMQNLARYRAKAAYPSGSPYDDNPRAADQRYFKGLLPHLLRRGSVPVFIARCRGRFAEPVGGGEDWHYVAMVRYRSRRDFLHFALAIERAGVSVHKWAALESTHVFPVQPLISLIFVRGAVAVLLAALTTLAWMATR